MTLKVILSFKLLNSFNNPAAQSRTNLCPYYHCRLNTAAPYADHLSIVAQSSCTECSDQYVETFPCLFWRPYQTAPEAPQATLRKVISKFFLINHSLLIFLAWTFFEFRSVWCCCSVSRHAVIGAVGRGLGTPTTVWISPRPSLALPLNESRLHSAVSTCSALLPREDQ